MKRTTGLKGFKYTSLVAITLLGAGTVTPLIANAATIEAPQNGEITDANGVKHEIPTDGSKLFVDNIVYYYSGSKLIAELNNGQYDGITDPDVNPADSSSAASSSSTQAASSSEIPAASSSSTKADSSSATPAASSSSTKAASSSATPAASSSSTKAASSSETSAASSSSTKAASSSEAPAASSSSTEPVNIYEPTGSGVTNNTVSWIPGVGHENQDKVTIHVWNVKTDKDAENYIAWQRAFAADYIDPTDQMYSLFYGLGFIDTPNQNGWRLPDGVKLNSALIKAIIGTYGADVTDGYGMTSNNGTVINTQYNTFNDPEGGSYVNYSSNNGGSTNTDTNNGGSTNAGSNTDVDDNTGSSSSDTTNNSSSNAPSDAAKGAATASNKGTHIVAPTNTATPKYNSDDDAAAAGNTQNAATKSIAKDWSKPWIGDDGNVWYPDGTIKEVASSKVVGHYTPLTATKSEVRAAATAKDVDKTNSQIASSSTRTTAPAPTKAVAAAKKTSANLPQTGDDQQSSAKLSVLGGLAVTASTLIFGFGFMRKYKHFGK
ncbi:extracellular protein [Liquorilactobacillus sucicola DSM 21376 = JCM 15457]|nr:hypothetical protein [Liquorilactobacillus sucicola]GAJ25415.1 extracellular protein [Liquorilactobacillus sucicola DSM 21376 = JCM 15457]